MTTGIRVKDDPRAIAARGRIAEPDCELQNYRRRAQNALDDFLKTAGSDPFVSEINTEHAHCRFWRADRRR